MRRRVYCKTLQWAPCGIPYVLFNGTLGGTTSARTGCLKNASNNLNQKETPGSVGGKLRNMPRAYVIFWISSFSKVAWETISHSCYIKVIILSTFIWILGFTSKQTYRGQHSLLYFLYSLTLFFSHFPDLLCICFPFLQPTLRVWDEMS